MRSLTRWIAAAALALLGSAAACAESCPPPPTPLASQEIQQGMQQAVDRGFLWRVGKDGKTSFLYGTLHVARRPWMFPGPQVQGALRSVDKVALEMDMLDPEIQRRLMTAITAPPGQPALPAPLQRRLSAQIDKACAGPELAALKPEMQAVTLTVTVGRRAGLEPAYGIDAFLAGFARGIAKPVLSLETPESQIGLLLQPTAAATESFVDHALDELESERTLPALQRLAEAWARSDLAELSSYADWCHCVETEEDRQLMRRMIDERNLAMADEMQRRHEAGEQLFVAVGALHMIGDQGLPALLKARGFDVRRLSPPADAAASR